jgi:chromosome segregation ATPase
MATIVTEKDIMKTKNEAMALRDSVISAKSTLESVLSNIDSFKKELKELGVDTEDIQSHIDKMAEDVRTTYDECTATINQWKEALS